MAGKVRQKQTQLIALRQLIRGQVISTTCPI